MTEHPAETVIPIIPPELSFDGESVFVTGEVVPGGSDVVVEEVRALVAEDIEVAPAEVELLPAWTPCAQVPPPPLSCTIQPRPFFETHPYSQTVTEAEFWQHEFPQHPRPVSHTLLSLQQSWPASRL